MSSDAKPSKLRLILGVNAVFLLLVAATLIESQSAHQLLLEEHRGELADLRAELSALRERQRELSEARPDALTRGELDERLATIQNERQRREEDMLEALELFHEALRARLDEAVASRDVRLDALSARLDLEQERLRELRRELDRARSRRQLSDTTRRLLSASVRINAKTEVGSGVVVYSGRRGADDHLETYILTAFHVVKDNLASKASAETPLEIDFYEEGAKAFSALARIVEVEPGQDLALLRVTREVQATPAPLANRKRLEGIDLFSPVVTIGCPLGYEPMPTHGEVTSTDRLFDEQRFWMMNAPTIFGNSGGGVFEEETGILLGVLIRIAAYKNVIDVAVPHLGIVTPLDQVAAWLAKTPYSFVTEGFDEPHSTSLTAGSER